MSSKRSSAPNVCLEYGKALVTNNGWIKVDYSNPPEEWVLVWSTEDGVQKALFEGSEDDPMWTVNSPSEYGDEFSLPGEEVTHWRPLPEGPKKEK